jgi:FkbM family methyltransferase
LAWRRAVRNVLARAGYRLGRLQDDGWSTANLRKPGLDPRVVLDVGVGRGTPRLYEAFPAAYFVLVEPLRENERHLEQVLSRYRGEYVLCAAGATHGVATIGVERERAGKSSLLDRTLLTRTAAEVEKREIPVKTIDQIVGESGLTGPFGLKIDTEGYELEVIRGATMTLASSQFVIAEVSIARRFEGGYSFAEFIDAMSGEGFRLSDVLSVSRAPQTHEGLFLDAMFRPV